MTESSSAVMLGIGFAPALSSLRRDHKSHRPLMYSVPKMEAASITRPMESQGVKAAHLPFGRRIEFESRGMP